MPNIVITRNTTVQHTPYGAVDQIFTNIDDTHIIEATPDFGGYGSVRAIGPEASDTNTPLFIAEDLHQIPSNAINIQARLYVYFGGAGVGSFDGEAREVLKPWLPYGATFNDYTTGS